MKRKISGNIIIAASIWVAGCNNIHDASKTEASTPDSAITTQENHDPNEQFYGAWNNGVDENATFAIGKDSIFYTDQMTNYPYKIVGDSITIDFHDSIYKGKIALVKDTLTMTNAEFGTMKLTRFKK